TIVSAALEGVLSARKLGKSAASSGACSDGIEGGSPMREVTAQRFGCWHGALLIVSLVATTGCLLYRGDRQPNLIGTGARATAPDAPRIEVVLHHRHTIDGKDAGGQATELTFKQMKSSWERVQKETPFLANAGSGIAKADFVLDLDTEVADRKSTRLNS